MARPAERVVPWFEYRNIFLTEERIAAGVRFWTEHAATLEQVAERYGVAPEMIVAIVGIETYFGTRMGRYRVLDALATLAFAYPPRATFFASRARAVPAADARGGSRPHGGAGLVCRRDGRRPVHPVELSRLRRRRGRRRQARLWTDWDDVFGSVANYFSRHGWRTGEPVMESATRPERFERLRSPRNSLDLGDTVGSLAKQGYVFTTHASRGRAGCGLFIRGEGGGSEYWVGYHNFHVDHALQPQHEVRARRASARARRSAASYTVASAAAASVAAAEVART